MDWELIKLRTKQPSCWCDLPSLLKLGLMFIIIASLAACGGGLEEEEIPDPQVSPAQLAANTREGQVLGSVAKGVLFWKGIPYAQPPVGDLRWREPKPPEARDQPWQANEFSSPCVQPVNAFGSAPEEVAEQDFWGSEDCLYLNIYAPPDAKDLPVMFWIHGGGNILGHAGQYDPSHLARTQKVVVVTYNYRLGPLGWWYYPPLPGTGLKDASGNYGLLDSLAALAWVRDNIFAFGGNASNVTLFGESAGGTNVAALVASPYGRGLFHAAIVQSGLLSTGASTTYASNYRDDLRRPGSQFSSREILLRFLMQENPEEDCDRNCARVRLAGTNSSQQIALARSIEAETLIGLYAAGDGPLGLAEMPKLILDGKILPKKGILKALKDRELGSLVPMILGSNRDEAKLFMGINPDNVATIGGVPLWRRDADWYELEAEYSSLAWKLYGVDWPVANLQKARVPVWAYQFDWDELADSPFVDFDELFGAAHAFELPFLFGDFEIFEALGPILVDDDNEVGRKLLSERIMAYWGAFAYHHDPNQGLDNKGLKWTPFNPKKGSSFIHLDADEKELDIAMSKENLFTLEALLKKFQEDERIDEDDSCELFEATLADFLPQGEVKKIAHKLGCDQS